MDAYLAIQNALKAEVDALKAELQRYEAEKQRWRVDWGKERYWWTAERVPDNLFDLSLGLNHGQINQTLNKGESVDLDVTNWRWSPLGLGSLLVAVLLLLSLLLQVVRRRLGFGFPELPS